MTKFIYSVFSLSILLMPSYVLAEDAAAPATEKDVEYVAEAAKDLGEKTVDEVAPALEAATPEPVIPTAPIEEAVVAPALDVPPVVENPPAAGAPVAAAPVISEVIPTDNLEFISGEISSVDEATQSVVVKLYGETESGTSDKTLKVTLDSTTDITDGEQDRDLKSLTAGTEVDVEYDPASNKATYIFVY